MPTKTFRLIGTGPCVKGVRLDPQPGEEITIGRHHANTLYLWRTPESAGGDYDYLSRRHCRIAPAADGWRIADCGSTNGTTVIDGRTKRALPLGEDGRPLAENDVIRLADCDHFSLMWIAIDPPALEDPEQLGVTCRLTEDRFRCLQLFDRGAALRTRVLEALLYLLPEGAPTLLGDTLAIPGIPGRDPVGMIAHRPGAAGYHFEAFPGGPSVLINNAPPTAAPLSNGDLLSFPDAPGISLLFLDPEAPSRRPLSDLLLDEKTITIGRGPQCSVPVAHPSLSRQHATILRRDGRLFVFDHGSQNGTFVDGVPAEGETEVPAGASLRLGALHFIADPHCFTASAPAPSFDIELDRLSFTIKGRTILHPLNLRLPYAHLIGVIGPSGGGKSTLLELIAGQRHPGTGSVRVNGRDIHQRGAFTGILRSLFGYAPDVAFVAQRDAVPENLSAGEILTAAARSRGLAPADAEHLARAAALDCGILEHWDRVVRLADGRQQLSGGQLKRLCVAQQLILEPRILILDEPCTGLDPRNSDSLTQIFRSLAQRGATLVMSTHEMENLALCHLVAVIALGRLVYFGPPQTLAAHFGAATIREAYHQLPEHPSESGRAEELAERFRQTRNYATYCTGLEDA